jgi:hypothetical protein
MADSNRIRHRAKRRVLTEILPDDVVGLIESGLTNLHKKQHLEVKRFNPYPVGGGFAGAGDGVRLPLISGWRNANRSEAIERRLQHRKLVFALSAAPFQGRMSCSNLRCLAVAQSR